MMNDIEFEVSSTYWMIVLGCLLCLVSALGVLTGMVIGWGAGVIAGVAVGLGIGEFLWAILEVLGGWM